MSPSAIYCLRLCGLESLKLSLCCPNISSGGSFRTLDFKDTLAAEYQSKLHNGSQNVHHSSTHSTTSLTPSLSTTFTVYFPGATTNRLPTSSMHRLRVAKPSSRVASGSWYLMASEMSESQCAQRQIVARRETKHPS
jgi:hypothetical protein